MTTATLATVRTSGVVLAGGASTRMGRDKAVLSFDGERLVDRAVSRLQEVAEDVVVASGRRTIAAVEVPQVRDLRGGSGPLSGLIAALLQVDHDLAHVLAVDLPHADPALFSALAGMWAGEAALIPSAGGRAQPLHAVWATSTAVGMSLLMADGVRSVLRVAETMGARFLTDEETRDLVGDDRWAHNLNTPADLLGDR
ncbi:molybdenum cofactor guanylyltransferase [soil metagenome]